MAEQSKGGSGESKDPPASQRSAGDHPSGSARMSVPADEGPVGPTSITVQTTGITRGGTGPEPQPQEMDFIEVSDSMRERWANEALEREKRAARTRGATDEELEDYEQNLTWVVSNRQDDRGYQEFDPRHPGGYMVVGGPVPDYVHRDTPMVQELFRSGEIVECPPPTQFIEEETPDGKRKVRNPFAPAVKAGGPEAANGTPPGHAIVLGRAPDKRIWADEGDRKSIRRAQARLVGVIPVDKDAIVPPGTPGQRSEQTRSRREREAAAEKDD